MPLIFPLPSSMKKSRTIRSLLWFWYSLWIFFDFLHPSYSTRIEVIQIEQVFEVNVQCIRDFHKSMELGWTRTIHSSVEGGFVQAQFITEFVNWRIASIFNPAFDRFCDVLKYNFGCLHESRLVVLMLVRGACRHPLIAYHLIKTFTIWEKRSVFVQLYNQIRSN